jgi:hypothetical protein
MTKIAGSGSVTVPKSYGSATLLISVPDWIDFNFVEDQTQEDKGSKKII